MSERFRFLIDESTLVLAATAGVTALSAAFEHLVERIQSVREHAIGKASGIWEEQLGAHPLYEWLFDPSLGVDSVAAKAMMESLSRTPDWDPVLGTGQLNAMVGIDGETQKALSVSAAASQARARLATGLLSALPSRSGELSVEVDGHASILHFIGVSRDVVKFFRDLPEIEDLDERAYFENAKYAFPAVIFVRERTRFTHFNEAYQTIRSKVTRHLGVINDHARDILAAAEPASMKETRFGSHGVEASGESSNTKSDEGAMKQRAVDARGKTVVCDWHTKIRRHIDRIYFNATTLDCVVVGVFRDHLE